MVIKIENFILKSFVIISRENKSPWDNTARFPWHPPLSALRRETCKCISLEKTLPAALHFQRQAQLVKVTPKRQKDRNAQFELDRRHASINFSFKGVMLYNCWFFVFDKEENTANFIWQYFVLVTDPRGTQWRHSTGNSCQS